MAKQRIVNTKFWDDSYIAALSPVEKLVFLYLITNPLTNISGVYELSVKRAAFDIGIAIGEIEIVFAKFEADGKLARHGGWIGVKNFIRHQNLNPKIRIGIVQELKRAPKEIVDSLSIDYRTLPIGCDGLLHLNSNSNLNTNSNSNGGEAGRLSTKASEEIHSGTRALARKWKVNP